MEKEQAVGEGKGAFLTDLTDLNRLRSTPTHEDHQIVDDEGVNSESFQRGLVGWKGE